MTGPVTRETAYWQAVNAALEDQLAADPDVVFFGEDVGRPGGIFGVTRNLQRKFGAERVWDTPISEAALVGCALGASLRGLRPVVELMFIDFSLVAADQIINHVAKMPYLSGLPVPLTIRTQQGMAPGSSAQHSQSLEAIFAHAAGLQIYLPACASDAYWLLTHAIREDEPVLVIENRLLYKETGPIGAASEDTRPGRARVLTPGTDLTIVSWSAAVLKAVALAEALADRGLFAEVIDLRTLVPLDRETVLASARSTGHLVVLHDATQFGGFGAELAAQIAEAATPAQPVLVQRFGAASTPVPAAPGLQRRHHPTVEQIAQAIAARRADCGRAAR